VEGILVHNFLPLYGSNVQGGDISPITVPTYYIVECWALWASGSEPGATVRCLCGI